MTLAVQKPKMTVQQMADAFVHDQARCVSCGATRERGFRYHIKGQGVCDECYRKRQKS